MLVLDLDQIEGGGQPTLEELAGAIREFRASGKKVIAYGDRATCRSRYYLAAQADEIYVDPLGFVLIDGYDRYRMFFKDVLDKLNVDINVFRVGEFKSAVENYTRNDMSPEDREESLALSECAVDGLPGAVTTARASCPPEASRTTSRTLSKAVPAANGDAAQVALKAGLVTGLKTRPEVETRLAGLVGEDETPVPSGRSATRTTLRIVARRQENTRRQATRRRHRRRGRDPRWQPAARHHRRGIDRAADPEGAHGQERAPWCCASTVRAAACNASEQIYREVQALRAAGKPVVVSMSELRRLRRLLHLGAGGRDLGEPGDHHRLHRHLRHHSHGRSARWQRSAWTSMAWARRRWPGSCASTGRWRDEARALLQSTVERGYEEFLQRVARGRKKTREQVDEIAQGRVWAGDGCASAGLVDQLGSFNDAVKAAARARS